MDGDSFKTAVASTGYIHGAAQRGSHGSAIFHGVRCPRCDHVFVPLLSATTKCPQCGFVESPSPGR